MYIDSHCHLNMLKLEQYDGDLSAMIEAARKVGVEHILCVATDLENSHDVIKIAEQYDDVTASIGLHPSDKADKEPAVEDLIALADHPKVIAIGETGLDYHYNDSGLDIMQERFRRHIRAAKKVKKPLIIHSREAGSDCLDILIKNNAKEVGGVFHCFAEDENFAKELKKINFNVSFTGALTFKNADETRRIFKEIPLEQILIETDGPFLAPMPYRGKLCRPAYILETAKKMAEIKDLKLEELCAILEANTRSFYKI